MKKKLMLFLLLFVFGITTVKAANVAEVNGKGYDTIAKAVNAAPNNTQTTITLIADRTNEKINIGSNKDIVLDLNDHTLTMNNDSNLIAISSGGKLEIINGTLITTASTKGMIDNNGGTLYITSGTYNANGGRQVVYNNAGTVYIQGGELEGNASARAAVHNLNNGKLYITGGKIVSNTLYAIYNEKGTLDIGTKDNVCNQTSPVIIGKTYGIIANNKYNFNVYDGIIKGETFSVGTTSNTGNTPGVSNDTNYDRVADIEVDSDRDTSDEIVGDITYKTLSYKIDPTKIKITFDSNDLSGNTTYKRISIGESIGEMPTLSRVDYRFDGWFTEPDGGTLVTEDVKPMVSSILYAHWTYIDPNSVAYVEGYGYYSLAAAFSIGGNIRLDQDVIITSSLLMNNKTKLDLNGHTITLNDNNIKIIEEVTIDDSTDDKKGKITSTADFTIEVGEENNTTNGKLIHKGGTIEGLGAYGAIDNMETTIIDGGTVTGDATESSNVIFNEKELIIESGTVYSANGRAVQVFVNSTFTMNGGLVKSDATNDQTVNLYGNCKATINGGTIEGLEHETAGIAMFGNTELVVNGGVIKGNSMAIAGNGKVSSANANITINGGTLSATTGPGLYLPQRTSTTTINGGDISGETGIEIRAADLIVNGGNITATYDNYESIFNDNGTTTKGIGIAVSQHTSQQPINVIINDGNIKGVVALSEVNTMNNPPEIISQVNVIVNYGNFEALGEKIIINDDGFPLVPFITGGIFTHDPSNYVKEGYGAVKLSDNKYEVTKIHNITLNSNIDDAVSIDNTKFLYKSRVSFKVKKLSGYEAVVNVIDAEGNKIDVDNNSFIMPDSNITIKVTYTKLVNPTTGDNISRYYITLFLSLLGLSSLVIYQKPRKDIL